MIRRLRRMIVRAIPEPMLRTVQQVRHRQTPLQRRWRRPQSTVTLSTFDAHAQQRENVAAVTAALDRRRIGYVLVPGRHDAVRQVGISGEDAGRVRALLADEFESRGWLVQADHGGSVLRAFRIFVAPGGQLLGGRELACELGFWPKAGRGEPRLDGGTHQRDTRIAPTDNRVVGYLTEENWHRAASSVEHWPAQQRVSIFEFREPVDVVYTWVDGADAAWRARRAAFHAEAESEELHDSAANEARYASRDELRYSLRSLAMYASWVRRIFIVTDGQTPSWLNAAHPKIQVVDHKEIFDEPTVLPVFNSHAIESQLHHIAGLAEHYLYLNDDVFFGRPVQPELFFHGNGIARFFLSPGTIGFEPPSARDLPVQSAAKQNRELLEEAFGVTATRKFQHTPHPQLRTVLEEMQRRHPDVFATVARSRFRHPDDVSIPSALHHYYAYLMGRAVPGDIDYRFQEIRWANTARRLDGLLHARPEVFCLNDNASTPEDMATQQAVLGEFFAAYFPLPSPFELGDD